MKVEKQSINALSTCILCIEKTGRKSAILGRQGIMRFRFQLQLEVENSLKRITKQKNKLKRFLSVQRVANCTTSPKAILVKLCFRQWRNLVFIF